MNDNDFKQNPLTKREIIESKIYFSQPPHDRVIDAISISNMIKQGDMEIDDEDLIINGYIYKTILYKTVMHFHGPELKLDLPHKIPKEHKKEKEKLCPIVKHLDDNAVDGVVRHLTMWIPFRVSVPVENIKSEQEYEVTSIELVSNRDDIKYITIDDEVFTNNYDDNNPLLMFISGVIVTDTIEATVNKKTKK